MKIIILIYFILYALIFLLLMFSNKIRKIVAEKSIKLWMERCNYPDLYLNICTMMFMFYLVMSLITYSYL